MKVKCRNCGVIHWETTEEFDPDKAPTGNMLRLLNPWFKNSWPIFGDGVMPRADGTGTSGTKTSELDCNECLAALAPSGRLRLVEEPKESDVPADGVIVDDGLEPAEFEDEPEAEVKQAKKRGRR